MKTTIFIISISLLLASCGGRSETDKLTHKWVVKTAYVLVGDDQTEKSEEYYASVELMNKQVDSVCVGVIYDIKDDGSFTITKAGESLKGDWKFEVGKMKFTSGGKVVEEWSFRENEVLIFADSTLGPNTILPGSDIPISMRLKPFSGEKVEPDKF